MVLVLILVQVVLVVLEYAAHVVSFSPWIVFLPALLIATLYALFLAYLLGGRKIVFALDTWSPFQ